MIKFFRHIRKELMETGKTGKYLKYALGEIVLVVIGILIALQINNWNENRKAYIKSKNYLSEIARDLQNDTLRFNRAISILDQLIQDEEWILNATTYSNADVNRLSDCLSGWYMDYDINDRTFQKIQNDGGAKLVGFDSLSEKINRYYTTVKGRTESITDWDKKDVTERHIYLRDLEESIELNNNRMHVLGAGHVKKIFPVRQDSLTNNQLIITFANSTRGRNHFKNNYIRHMRIRNWFVDVVKDATKLIEEIKKESEE